MREHTKPVVGESVVPGRAQGEEQQRGVCGANCDSPDQGEEQQRGACGANCDSPDRVLTGSNDS